MVLPLWLHQHPHTFTRQSPRLTSTSKWVGDPDYTFTTWHLDRSVQVGAAAWVVDGRGTAPAGGQPPDK